MADFDPFANQGGPAAWDPEHTDDSKAQADALLKKLAKSSGAEPGNFGGGESTLDADEDEDDVDVDVDDEL